MISPRAILAAVDFSDASHAALVLAARLARQHGAALHVLYVEDPWLDRGADREGIDLAASSRVELRRLVREAPPAPECSPELHVAAGRDVGVILEVAHHTAADLIVVASRRLSGVERLVFGSATERLLRQSDVSVLIAPEDWVPPDAEVSKSPASGAGALAGVLGSWIEVVRGANGSSAQPIAYRALSAAAVPILLQVVDSVLG